MLRVEVQHVMMDGAVGRALYELTHEHGLLRTEDRWSHEPMAGMAAVGVLLRQESKLLERATLSGTIWADIDRNMGVHVFVQAVIEQASVSKALLGLAHLMRGRIPEEDWLERYEVATALAPAAPRPSQSTGKGGQIGVGNFERYGASSSFDGGGENAFDALDDATNLDGKLSETSEAGEHALEEPPVGMLRQFLVLLREDVGDVVGFYGGFHSAQQAKEFGDRQFGDQEDWVISEMFCPVAWQPEMRDDVVFPFLISSLREIGLSAMQMQRLARAMFCDERALNALFSRAELAHLQNWQVIEDSGPAGT